MALKMEKVAVIPAGNHLGIITCQEIEKTFGPGQKPETVYEVVIQPKWRKEGYRTLPVNATFGHSLTTLSGMGRFLARIGRELADGEEFVPQSIDGTEVAFTAAVKEDGFVVVNKDSIRKA